MIGNVKCEDISIIVRILAKSVKVLQFAIPIILIVMIIFDIFKVVVGQTDDKAKKDASNKIIQRAVYSIIIFLVPIVVNYLLSAIAPKSNGLDSSWYDCWVKYFNETLSFSGSNGSSGNGSTKKVCENYGQSNCPITCYVYSGGCHSTAPTPTPTPKPISTPTGSLSPTPIPKPKIIDSYAYAPTNGEMRSYNPTRTQKAIIVGSFWDDNGFGHLLGIRIEYNYSTTKLAYAGSTDITKLKALTSINDFDPRCDVVQSARNLHYGKIEEESSASCKSSIHNLTFPPKQGNDLYGSTQAKYNIAFDLDELDQGNRASDYYVGVWAVNDLNEMSEPKIYHIHTGGDSNHENWTVTSVN